MAIYEYRCPNCGTEKDIILPIKDCDSKQNCDCGEVMTKRVSLPMPAIFVTTNRDGLVNMINGDDKAYKIPSNKHRKRYESVIASSLTADKPTIGKGFGPFKLGGRQNPAPVS
jgi:putative FmdB family regulatory protein